MITALCFKSFSQKSGPPWPVGGVGGCDSTRRNRQVFRSRIFQSSWQQLIDRTEVLDSVTKAKESSLLVGFRQLSLAISVFLVRFTDLYYCQSFLALRVSGLGIFRSKAWSSVPGSRQVSNLPFSTPTTCPHLICQGFPLFIFDKVLIFFF